jgi:hypothetical protein
MSATGRAAHLRQRAGRLRRLAQQIEALSVLRLDRHADDLTWRGPRPHLCRSLLAINQHQLRVAIGELHGHAVQLDRRADEWDAVARTTIGVPT